MHTNYQNYMKLIRMILVSSDTSQFYDLEGNPIDMREISLKRGEYYIIDDCSIALVK